MEKEKTNDNFDFLYFNVIAISGCGQKDRPADRSDAVSVFSDRTAFSIYFLLLSDLGSFLDSFDIPCSWAGSISSVFHDPNAFCALPQG